jgi:hypothetical protein
MRIKVKLEGYESWKHVVITEYPMSCGCGPTLEDLIREALVRDGDFMSWEDAEETKILAYRKLDERHEVGVTTLRVVERSRAYGGPEEGGWYYDCEELIREIVVPTSRLGTATGRLMVFCERQNEGLKSWEEGRLAVRVGRYERKPRPHYC